MMLVHSLSKNGKDCGKYLTCAHELLAEDIETVRDVFADDVVFVFEGATAKGMVVIVVVV
jgi:hypothetical protein